LRRRKRKRRVKNVRAIKIKSTKIRKEKGITRMENS
jgi:hypothetical protein